MRLSPSLPARSAPSSSSTKKGATPSTTKRMLKKLASSASKLVRSSAPRTLPIKVNNVRYKGSPPKPTTFLELPNNILGEIMKNLSLKNRSAVTSASKQARRELPHNVTKLQTAKKKLTSYVNSMQGPKQTLSKTRQLIMDRNPHNLANFSNAAPNLETLNPIDYNIDPVHNLLYTDDVGIAHGWYDDYRIFFIDGNEKRIARACIDGAMGSVRHIGYHDWSPASVHSNNDVHPQPAGIVKALKMGAWPNLLSLSTSVDNGIVDAFLSREKSQRLTCVGLPPARVMRACTKLKILNFRYTSGKGITDNINPVKHAIEELIIPFEGLSDEVMRKLTGKIVQYMPNLKKLVLTADAIEDVQPFKMRARKVMRLPFRCKLEIKYLGPQQYRRLETILAG